MTTRLVNVKLPECCCKKITIVSDTESVDELVAECRFYECVKADSQWCCLTERKVDDPLNPKTIPCEVKGIEVEPCPKK